MNALWVSSLACAVTTMVLNAHYGWSTSSDPFYAGMMATVSVAFDVAKSSLLVAASVAWRRMAHFTALLCFLLFWPMLAYSIHAGVAQILRDRNAATASISLALEDRKRAEDEHRRLSTELTLMLSNPLYLQSAACTNLALRGSRESCGRIDQAKARIATLDAQLRIMRQTNPEPHVVAAAHALGWTVDMTRLALALAPILLAELCGSLGFYLAARLGTPFAGLVGNFSSLPFAPSFHATKTQPDAVPLPSVVGGPRATWSVAPTKPGASP